MNILDKYGGQCSESEYFHVNENEQQSKVVAIVEL